jgi:hypothetical protein
MIPFQVGGFFRVRCKSRFARGQIHQAWRIRREKVRGNDDDLDLGVMVEFIIEDHFARPCRHAIPIEWCEPVEQPSIARRVKGARFSQHNTAEPPRQGLPH